MLKDALRTLKFLSQFLQRDKTTLATAGERISKAKDSVFAMKTLPGKSLNNFLSSFDSSASFKGVALKKNVVDADIFISEEAVFSMFI